MFEHRYLVPCCFALGLAGAGLLSPHLADAGAGLACGGVVGPGQTVTLTANIGPCASGTGTAAVTVDSGTLDLGGFEVTCDTVDPVDGIVLAGAGAVVINGTVRDCSRGIVVGGTGKHRVSDMNVHTSVGDGLEVLEGSDKNKLAALGSFDNGGDGIQIDGDKNGLTGCTASNNDDGVEVDGDKNKVRDCVTLGNDDGFDIDGDKNKLSANNAEGNADGYIVGGVGNKLVGNAATNNDVVGMELNDGSKATKNTVMGQGGDGILVVASADAKATVAKNTVTDNATDSGFDLNDLTAGCGKHKWKGNLFGTSSEACVQ